MSAKVLELNHFKGQFFTIVDQTDQSQIGVMTLKPGQTSGGSEQHPGDQIVYIVEGSGSVVIDGQEHAVSAGMATTIPAKTDHQIKNTSQDADLFLFSVYAPPAY